MSKNATEQLHWQKRAASYSTRSLKTGVNILGWEEPETLSATQERDALQLRLRYLRNLAEDEALTKAERKKLGQEIFNVQEAIRAIRPKLSGKFPGIQKFIVDIVKERLPPGQFKAIVEEAFRRCAKFSAEHEQESRP